MNGKLIKKVMKKINMIKQRGFLIFQARGFADATFGQLHLPLLNIVAINIIFLLNYVETSLINSIYSEKMIYLSYFVHRSMKQMR